MQFGSHCCRAVQPPMRKPLKGCRTLNLHWPTRTNTHTHTNTPTHTQTHGHTWFGRGPPSTYGSASTDAAVCLRVPLQIPCPSSDSLTVPAIPVQRARAPAIPDFERACKRWRCTCHLHKRFHSVHSCTERVQRTMGRQLGPCGVPTRRRPAAFSHAEGNGPDGPMRRVRTPKQCVKNAVAHQGMCCLLPPQG